jgi:S-DNA-T family DNA segregation ATPase FtsK/SpoIIIE
MAEIQAGPPEPDDAGPRPDDAESYVQEPTVHVKVTSQPEPPTVYATVTQLATSERRPIIPAWMRTSDARRVFLAQMWGLFWYSVMLQAWSTPGYLAKAAYYAPWGLLKFTGRQLRWMWHPELTQMMQHSATANDVTEGMRAADKVSAARKARAYLLLAELVAAVVGGLLLWYMAPWWVFWLAVAVAVPVFARIGRPEEKPIIQHVTVGKRFTRLTQEQVRNALVALRLTGLTKPGDISFPPPGVRGDGPGWLARFDLPPGLVASDVLAKRDRLSGALRLPLDQVWPEVGPEHLAQVDLWVGFKPASAMGEPKWDLAKPTAATSIFEPHAFATDARGRPIDIILFQRNILMGGQPGAGKSFGARAIMTIAGLDPTCEMKVAEFKGVGDFLDLEPLCTDYACGVDDEAFDIGEAIIDWALAECERRGARIKKLRQTGVCPDGMLTPEIVRKVRGLHPVVILIDELHELLLNRKGVAEKLERVLRRGRAMGIIFILATQIPDANTIPTGITKMVSIRICMSVADWQSNDQILGTGAYKRGHTATMFRPGYDQGWGVMQGLRRDGETGRTYFPDPEARAAIVERMRVLRGGKVVGDQGEKLKARDMLADARSCLRNHEAGVPWGVLADRLAELDPETYAGITGDMVRTALERYDIVTDDVKVKVDGKWTNLKGMRRKALEDAIAKRAIEG